MSIILPSSPSLTPRCPLSCRPMHVSSKTLNWLQICSQKHCISYKAILKYLSATMSAIKLWGKQWPFWILTAQIHFHIPLPCEGKNWGKQEWSIDSRTQDPRHRITAQAQWHWTCVILSKFQLPGMYFSMCKCRDYANCSASLKRL